ISGYAHGEINRARFSREQVQVLCHRDGNREKRPVSNQHENTREHAGEGCPLMTEAFCQAGVAHASACSSGIRAAGLVDTTKTPARMPALHAEACATSGEDRTYVYN